MSYFNATPAQSKPAAKKEKFYKKRWFKIAAVIFGVLMIAGGFFAWKTGSLLSKISGGKSGLLSTIIHSLPGVKDELKGAEEGRINVLLLGLRGENMVGGGLLTDTIMLVSLNPQDNKVAMISIPRDLYVTAPGTQSRQKINAVHAYGEQKEKGQGLEDMKTVVGEVTGQEVHYAISIDFKGFTQLIDSIGGITLRLDSPFTEALQFKGLEARCDAASFTVRSGNVEKKKVERKNGSYYYKTYPLCYMNPKLANLECGGNFSLPAGDVDLDGEKALCYVRSRVTSSDFERARRQQAVIQAFKNKLLSTETLTSFEKLDGIMNSLGNNIRTDLLGWEIAEFYNLYRNMQNHQVYQKVLENSEDGMLYHPGETNGAGYILLPRGDNYDRVHEMAQNIFNN